MIHPYHIEEGDIVRYDDGFDQLIAEIISAKNDTAQIKFLKGNRRHLKSSKEEVSLEVLYPMDAEERLIEQVY